TMAQKINEAHEHIAKAEKYLKTSLMKWKPDYDSAASEYAKAAVCFKNARQLEQAKDAYLQEAEAHTGNRSYPSAARAQIQESQAGMMLKVSAGSVCVCVCVCVCRLHQTPHTLGPAADKHSCPFFFPQNEDRLRQAVELVGKASRLLVRQQKFAEAAVSLQKEKNMYKEIENYPTCFKKTIAQVLVHLHRGDYVAAEKCVRESYSIPGFSGSEDCVAMEQLLQGYDEQDEEQVSRVCTSPLLRYMDNDYAKLAISLRVPGGGKKKAAAAAAAAASGDAGAAPPEEDEDEYAGGLC
uniref:Gamma-soluble NSF attachment protein n=1 Tax=Cyprinus carpio TaxID=7962 RepID=A0A8C1VC11_CYPCA